MKKLLIFLLIPVVFSCNSDSEMQKLKSKNDSLSSEAGKKDKVINDFISSFNEIQDNLTSIKEKEKIIRVNTAEGSGITTDAKERINEDILTIYKLMLDNKNKLSDLNNRLKNSNLKISEFQKMIEKLTKDIENKNTEIESLKGELEKLHFDVSNLNIAVDSLSKQNNQKAELINEQTSEINTAYYVFGTKKELVNHQIVTKEGGFIGIGKMAKLKDNFDKNYFTKIDIRETTSISLNTKKADILTTHPKNSYELTMDGKKVSKLVIKSPKDFWGVSKYLVIVVD